MKLIMDKVKNLSTATGFNVSMFKSKIYFGGVDGDTCKIIQQEIGFAICTMPLKYLGVPLASRKLLISQYQQLVENMLVRFNHWSNRRLSYAGRFQPVKGLIFSIANY